MIHHLSRGSHLSRVKIVSVIVSALVGVVLIAGCGRPSPYVGVWSGQAKVSSNAPAIMAIPLALVGNISGKLTLNADGKGFLKTNIAPEQAITWTEQDGNLVLYRTENNASGGASPGGSTASSGNLVGHLSPDRQTLTIDMGPVALDLHPDKG